MRKDIHPEYMKTHVTCSCGNSFTTRSTKPELHVELCSQCHPFYTGKQKLVDTGGRVERFQKKYAKQRQAAQHAKAAAAAPSAGDETAEAGTAEGAPAEADATTAKK